MSVGHTRRAIQDLREAIDDWRDYSKGTHCDKPIYHAQLNPDRDLSREEWDKAISIFEKEMGLENHPRAVVMHEKKGREHIHIVYSRFDHNPEHEHMRAWSDSWNYPKHERASRDIEKELGLEKTAGVFIDRKGERPERTPDHAAMQQADRTKTDPRQVKAEVSELYKNAEKNGQRFVDSLEDKGYSLARGDQRGYVIIDPAGGTHSLSRMTGCKVAELRETLQDYPLQNLPSIQQVRENRAEIKDLERQAFAAQLEIGTQKREPATPTGREAAAPLMGTDKDDSGSKGMKLESGAVNALADGVVTVLSSALDFLSGDAKPAPTPEQQKAINTEQDKREAERQALKDVYRRYEQERAQKQEQEIDKDKEKDQSRSLDLFRK